MDSFDELAVEGLRIALARNISVGNNRKIGIWAYFEALDFLNAMIEISGEKKFLFDRCAEGSEAVKLQRQPEPHASEMLRQLGRQISRRKLVGNGCGILQIICLVPV